MKISKIMKKGIFTFLAIIMVFSIFGGVLFFLPNEISFKIYNLQGNAQTDNNAAQELFNKAGQKFPNWDIISQNNSFDREYKEKKYDELSKKLNKIIEQNCNIKSKQISQYCENIFYLNGLVQYRLGEDKSVDKQKVFFQNAIDEFQKTLVINSGNKWAQENIDFIMKKFKQNKKQEEQQNNGQKQNEEKKQGKKQDKKSGDNQQNDNQQQKQNQGEKNGNDTENKKGESKEQKDGQSGKEDKSRLPQEMQKQLDQYQQQLEQEQGQQGFNRSKSAAEKNNLENQDPFDQMMNDPIFQQFFGNDPMMQNTLNQKNLNKTIQNPNEKDW